MPLKPRQIARNAKYVLRHAKGLSNDSRPPATRFRAFWNRGNGNGMEVLYRGVGIAEVAGLVRNFGNFLQIYEIQVVKLKCG